jgi:hypothetical protein
MRLYPPYRRWHVPIKDPEAFRDFLERHIEYHHTQHTAKLVGSLHPDGFFVRIKGTRNQYVPRIKGVITTDAEGQQHVRIGMESGNALAYILAIFSLFMLLTAIFEPVGCR